MQIYFDKDGIAKEYDGTHDVIIHCETQGEHDEVVKQLKESNWITVEERMPEETELEEEEYSETIFASEWLLWTIKPKGGEWAVYVGRTRRNGQIWEGLSDSRGLEGKKAELIAWKPLPEPYKGERS